VPSVGQSDLATAAFPAASPVTGLASQTGSDTLPIECNRAL
jgi:hypothetical protein